MMPPPMSALPAKLDRVRRLRVVSGRVLLITAAMVLTAGYLVFQYTPVRNYFYPKQFRTIVDGKLFVSGQIYAGIFKQSLSEHHITRIISFTEDPNDADDRAEVAACSAMGISRVVYPLDGNGTGDIMSYANALTEAIKTTNGTGPTLLVHCHSGSERSGAFVAFYRLLVEHRPPNQVLAEMEAYHWNPNRNPGLVRYINNHMAELSQILLQRGVISQIPDPMPQLSL
jgi:hypothetical protein